MEIKISIQCNDEELLQQFEAQLLETGNIKYDKAVQSGFDGLTLFLYFLVIGESALILALQKIIVALIKKNDVKSVKIGDKEIKGYKVEDVKKLLHELNKDVNNEQ